MAEVRGRAHAKHKTHTVRKTYTRARVHTQTYTYTHTRTHNYPTTHHTQPPPQVLMEFPQLTMSLPDGREESIMKRTCLVRRGAAPPTRHAATSCRPALCAMVGIGHSQRFGTLGLQPASDARRCWHSSSARPPACLRAIPLPRWPTRPTCPWPRARRPSTRASPWRSTSGAGALPHACTSGPGTCMPAPWTTLAPPAPPAGWPRG